MPASVVLGRVSCCGVAQGYASLDPLPAALLRAVGASRRAWGGWVR